jgi:large subunit ribosomal protein L9
MELLLLEDINGVGKKNDIVIVGDGFALNCLLPQRRALVATPTVRKRYAELIKRRALERENERRIQMEASQALQGKVITLSRKVNKTNKLYAALSESDISRALMDQHQLDIPSDRIVIDEPIKTVGNAQVKVQVGSAQFPITVNVMKEEAAAKKAA